MLSKFRRCLSRLKGILLLSKSDLKRGVMMKDNNKALLSKPEAYQNIMRLLKLQERLSSDETLKCAKQTQNGSKSCTAVNPII